MLIPDFSKYNLAIICEEKIIFSSGGNGLRPLWDFLENYHGQEENLVLHDKVIGLAAARLVVYSGIISEVRTDLASKPAKSFLDEKGIKMDARLVVDNILTKDRNVVCPGEIIALNHSERDEFYSKIRAMMNGINEHNFR